MTRVPITSYKTRPPATRPAGRAFGTTVTSGQLAAWAATHGLAVDHGPGGMAVFSPDAARTYRYVLSRTWAAAGSPAVWLLPNPSTADSRRDDATIRRLIGFARREGHTGLLVVNLFALRATDPRALARHVDPVGEHDDDLLTHLANGTTEIIAGWGAGYGHLHGRAAAVVHLLTTHGVALSCLGTTQAGHPRHSLYLPASAPLQPYQPERTHA